MRLSKKQRLENSLKNAIKAGNRSKAAWAIVELERLENTHRQEKPSKTFEIRPLNREICEKVKNDTIAYFKQPGSTQEEKRKYTHIARQWEFLAQYGDEVLGYYEINNGKKQLMAGFQILGVTIGILDISYIASHFDFYHETSLWKVVLYLKNHADLHNLKLRVDPYEQDIKFWENEGFVMQKDGEMIYTANSGLGKQRYQVSEKKEIKQEIKPKNTKKSMKNKQLMLL